MMARTTTLILKALSFFSAELKKSHLFDTSSGLDPLLQLFMLQGYIR